MLKFVIKRAISSIPVVIIVSIIVFLLIDNAGDPLAGMRNNPRVKPSEIARQEKNLGLDQPIYKRYFIWTAKLAKGDFGKSISKKQPVSKLIASRFPATMLLMVSAFALSAIIAIFLGTLQALKRQSLLDYVVTGFVFLGYSMPVFWLGMMLQHYFGFLPWDKFGIRVAFTSGMYSPGMEGNLMNLFQHLFLPVLTVAIIQVAIWSGYQRSAVISEIDAPYVKLAKAKGLSKRKIIWRHILRNALIPVVTVMTVDAGYLFNGAVVVESVFSWPGMGLLFYEAIADFDYPLVMGILMFSTVFVIVFNLFSDIINALLDPRIRLDE